MTGMQESLYFPLVHGQPKDHLASGDGEYAKVLKQK